MSHCLRRHPNFALKFRAEGEKRWKLYRRPLLCRKCRFLAPDGLLRAEHYLAENGREGEVSAAVELIKTAAAGFREQERIFSPPVACYKITF